MATRRKREAVKCASTSASRRKAFMAVKILPLNLRIKSLSVSCGLLIQCSVYCHWVHPCIIFIIIIFGTIAAFLEDFSEGTRLDLRVDEGIQPIVLPCSYMPGALREFYHVEWSFSLHESSDSFFIITDNAVHDRYEILENFSLQIRNASVEQSGEYRCFVDVRLTSESANVRQYRGSPVRLTVLQGGNGVGPSPGEC